MTLTKKTLGRTGLEVTQLGYGAMEVRGSRTAFLLRFLISHPHIHTTIIGTLHPSHLQENITIADRGPLSAEVYAEAKQRLDAVDEKPAA